MSAQSIYIKTVDTVKCQLEQDICKQAKNFVLKKRFELGKGVNRVVRNHALISLKYIDTENCELIRYINQRLKGCEIESDNNTSFNLWIGLGNKGTKACFAEKVEEDPTCIDACWTEKEW